MDLNVNVLQICCVWTLVFLDSANSPCLHNFEATDEFKSLPATIEN